MVVTGPPLVLTVGLASDPILFPVWVQGEPWFGTTAPGRVRGAYAAGLPPSASSLLHGPPLLLPIVAFGYETLGEA